MILSIIVAMTEDRVIGKANRLPWHLSEDLVRFKKITMGHPIIMGRKTYDSIGRPLPGRDNIVISRNPSLKLEGAIVVPTWEEALRVASEKNGEAFIIGGAAIFELALPRANRLYLTLIQNRMEGDTYFPPINLDRDFEILEKTDHTAQKGEPLRFSFITAQPRSHTTK